MTLYISTVYYFVTNNFITRNIMIYPSIQFIKVDYALYTIKMRFFFPNEKLIAYPLLISN